MENSDACEWTADVGFGCAMAEDEAVPAAGETAVRYEGEVLYRPVLTAASDRKIAKTEQLCVNSK